MDRGVVTELGTHDELVAAGGAYAALWRSWHGTTDTPRAGAQAAARSSRPAACASPEGSP